jgi:glycosyltransferase involved in cell wall biosynthesis
MINIFMLVKDRREFTALTLDHLERFTDFDLIHRLVFVDDSSTDGAAEVCREWVARTGHGEVITIEGGSVTNALFHGTQPYLDDPIRWMVKLDNDLILSEEWLEKVLIQAEKTADQVHMVGFPMVGEFFQTSPEDAWAERLPQDYGVGRAPYTGGNFMMRWGVFKQTRHIGVVDNPLNYIQNSLSEVHKLLSEKGILKVGIMVPALPVFKLDKVADPRYRPYAFLEKRGIELDWIRLKIQEYYQAGMCRKRLVGDQIRNEF